MNERNERRGLARDGIQMATDTMHNNNPKVHSGTHKYNFKRIGHFLILFVAVRMNTNTQKAVYTPCKSLLKKLMNKNTHFILKEILWLYMFREKERVDTIMYTQQHYGLLQCHQLSHNLDQVSNCTVWISVILERKMCGSVDRYTYMHIAFFLYYYGVC